MLEEERITEIERDNRILYTKIMGQFQSLKQTTQCRHKWLKRKRRANPEEHEQNSFNSSKMKTKGAVQFRSKVVQSIRESKVEEPHTLFLGQAWIDGIEVKAKVSLGKEGYLLLAHNGKLSIELEMEHGEYMRIHHSLLSGNPCNIFRFLEIEGESVRFREQPVLKASSTKTVA
jgi:hypothetical protein